MRPRQVRATSCLAPRGCSSRRTRTDGSDSDIVKLIESLEQLALSTKFDSGVKLLSTRKSRGTSSRPVKKDTLTARTSPARSELSPNRNCPRESGLEMDRSEDA
eukprot:768672-Hanusia_phi.AAC.2